MATQPPTYRFGEFSLEAADRRLFRNSAEVTLRPKAFDTLRCLVVRHGHTVRKEELFEAVWAGTFVSDAVLTHCITEVRQALRDDPRAPRFVRTLPKVGYSFIADVELAAAPADEAPFLRSALEVPPASAIAVLPFVNLSADPDNEYFCDGLSEELINGLTKIPELRVVAHSSSFSFKGRDADVREIGRQLGVGSILEGSVRKAGGRLRISAQLIDTTGGFHAWCEQYDRDLGDVFALQDEISRSVLAALKVKLAGPVRTPLITASTVSMDAYLLYLQGRAYWHRRFEGVLQKAMTCFEQAIQKDPGFALAYSGLADCFGSLAVWAFVPPHDAFPKAAALARQALDMNPALAEGYTSAALVHLFYDWDWQATERDLARSLDLNPGSSITHLLAGHYLSVVGRFDEAIAEVLQAQALDPLSPVVNPNVGWTFYLAGRHDRAREELERVLLRFPESLMTHFYLGYVWAALGRLDEALASFRVASESSGGMPFAAESAGWVLAMQGRRDEARRVLSASLARAATTYVPTSAIALIHLGLGDDEALFACLDRCVEERDAMLAWAKFMPVFDRVRPDPRFQAILSRIGLA